MCTMRHFEYVRLLLEWSIIDVTAKIATIIIFSFQTEFR